MCSRPFQTVHIFWTLLLNVKITELQLALEFCWLVCWLAILGLMAISDSISVYFERGKKKREQPPSAPTVSIVGPCLTIIPNNRTPRNLKLPSGFARPRLTPLECCVTPVFILVNAIVIGSCPSLSSVVVVLASLGWGLKSLPFYEDWLFYLVAMPI